MTGGALIGDTWNYQSTFGFLKKKSIKKQFGFYFNALNQCPQILFKALNAVPLPSHFFDVRLLNRKRLSPRSCFEDLC